MKVKDAMHADVQWVQPDTPLPEVARLMQSHDIGSIPVGDNDKLVGMVTDRDIVVRGLTSSGFDPNAATVRDVMSKGIHCCREDDELEAAVSHMKTHGVRRLPVINARKRMVGILSMGDITHAADWDVSADYARAVSAHHK